MHKKTTTLSLLRLLAFITTISTAAAAEPVPPGKPADRPNVLMVHCHDLGQYLHCYGVKTVQTPNLDTFATQGVRFSRSFCTAPGCSPSRASIFTGRYPHNNGVMGLCHGFFGWDLNPEEQHLAQILKGAGFATVAVGVVHETSSGTKRCGYDQNFPVAMAEKATDKAIEWMRNPKRPANQPFFMSLGFIEPHRLSYKEPPEGFTGLQPGDNTFPGVHLKPDSALGVEIPGYLKDTAGTRLELAGLQGAVKHVDTQFGRLMAVVEELGLKNNTLVIFTTDHGVAMPRAKCSLYEPGVQVAFLLRFPGRPGWHGGVQQAALVSNIDYVPTILDFLKLPIHDKVQGKSLAPLLDGQAYTPRREVFTELTYHNYYDPRRAIRTETHKLIVNFSTAPAFMDPSQCWRPPSETTVPATISTAYHPYVELYDLTQDPWEQKDLAKDPKLTPVREDLLRRLHQHLVDTSDPILSGAITSPHHRQAMKALKPE
jgi:arylsulfatase A-like enzyme